MERLERVLSEDERERAARFHFRKDFERYVTARAHLRLQLASYLDCDPGSLSFQYTEFGKPFLPGSSLRFNLSHSGDWILYAFTEAADVGIDIEQIKSMADTLRNIAQQNFSLAEFSAWEALPEEDKVGGFYRCWTRKEAFVKAMGEGLSCPLDSFEVEFGPGKPAQLNKAPPQAGPVAQWFMADLPGFDGYAAALAIRRQGLDNPSLPVLEISNVK
jgi:4'-phosphopantetheinyl transferase